ncbi:mucin-3A-like [Megalobrama amblycephala]|uniref:mucin-3A-like n=1 Tax=Megalobrama amblycephala TaxID=75352 RepID=UPI0020141D20|nr:mucin-3A-like [Megalobrama amblycephala]
MSSLWLPLLLSSVIWAEEDYFHISPNATWDNYTFPDRNTTWDEARDHCQKCFKELTTITSRNVHLIVQEDASLDYWIGLRRSYNGTVSWSRWSNGKPITYQNWYPGHPVPNKEKKMIPRCFSTTETPPSTLITTTTQTSPVTTLVTSPETSPETSPVTSTVTTLVTSPETSPVTTLVTSPETSPVTSTVTTLLTSPKTSPETFTVTTLVTFPETSPETSPVTSTVTSTVTSPEISPETSPETFPETSPETFPETSPETSPPNTPEDTCPILTGILDCLNITYYDLEDVVQNCTCVKPEIVTPKTTTDCTTPHATTFSTIFSTTTSGTTTESTTSESTSSESTTTESTTLESTTLESTTTESTTTESTTTESTMSESTTSESTMTESTMSESTTTESTTASNCIFEPEPDPDVYIEDACVVLLSYGMWKEVNCNESQHFICYDERFIGEISITNVTTRVWKLSWSEAPGNITHYRVELTRNKTKEKLIWSEAPGNTTYSTVETTGNQTNQTLSSSEAPGSTTYSTVGIAGIQSLSSSEAPGNTTHSTVGITGNPTNQTFNNNKTRLYTFIEDLTPGNLYSVQVIPVKCGRDLNPQNISFYTIPSPVKDLTVVNVTTDTVSLKWSIPEGDCDFYKVYVKNVLGQVEKIHKYTSKECTIMDLTPGNKYEFIVTATVNETTEGVPNSVSDYTIPPMVSDLTSANNDSTNITAYWKLSSGQNINYRYCLKLVSNTDKCTDCNFATKCITKNCTDATNSNITTSCNITENCNNAPDSNITTNHNITENCNNVTNSNITTNRNFTENCNYTTDSNIATNCSIIKNCSFSIDCDTTENKLIQVKDKKDGAKYCLCVAALTKNGTLSGKMVGIPAYTLPKSVSLFLFPDSQYIYTNWSIDGNYEKFNVMIKTANNTLENITLANLTYTFKNLKAGVEYTVTVITLNGDLRSHDSTKSAYTKPTKPGPAKAITHDKTSITVSWEEPAESTGANISYKVDYHAPFWGDRDNTTIKKRVYTFSNLKSGTRYNFDVRVLAGNDESPAVSTYADTEPEKKTLTLTMLCSSQTALQCEKNETQTELLKQLNGIFKGKLQENVYWRLKWVERKNNP